MLHQLKEMIEENYTLYFFKTNKFKTNYIRVIFMLPLEEEKISARALLPQVLTRGTRKNPATVSFKQAIEDLYGANLSKDVTIQGDQHIINFRFNVPNERFINQAPPLFVKALQLLSELLFDPLITDQAFDSHYVKTEKIALDKHISTLIDDKVEYSRQRCLEIMFAHEIFRFTAEGTRESLAKVDEKLLFQVYQELIQKAEIRIYVVGEIEEAHVRQVLRESFTFPSNREQVNYFRKFPPIPEITLKEVSELQDINQGKLNMGYRIPMPKTLKEAVILQLFNGVFGGYPHSKLFMNVREKASLAYYAMSRADSNRGALMVMAGIAIENYSKAVAIINEQLELIKNGEISDLELEQTQSVMINSIRSSYDSANAITESDFSLRILEIKLHAIEDLILTIQEVNKEEISSFAKQIVCDTIYFLKKGE